MPPSVDDVGSTARRAEQSPWTERLGRVGLAARTVVWFVLAGLVVQLALGLGTAQSTDQSGALKSIAGTAWGTVLLVALVLGFLLWAGYQLLAAAVGHRGDTDDKKRLGHRLKSLAEGLLYLLAALSAYRVLTGAGADSEQQTTSLTARIMGVTGGRTLVGLLGLAAVALAAALAWRAVQRKHAEKLDGSRVPAQLRRPAVTVGVVGLLGRAAVVGLVGVFLVQAALAFDAAKAKGLDASLRTVAEQPFGQLLLGLAAVGILAYAVWSLVETLWRDL